MTKKILTHGGIAHADEMYACGLLSLLCDGDITITRKNYEENDGEAFDFVVDTGMKFDNEKFFDHHQSDENVEGRCSASLVAERFFPELHLHLKTFFKRLDKQDNGGLGAVGNPADIIPLLQAEFHLVKEFEKRPEEIADIFRKYFKGELEFLKNVKEAKEWLADLSHSEIVKVGNVNILLIKEKPSFPSFCFNKAQEGLIDKHDIHVVCSFDIRNPEGRTLFRTRKCQLDFNSLEVQGKYFCHKNGFILNYKPKEKVVEELIEIFA